MRHFRLLGKPVKHSLSPLLYQVAFRELELDATYDGLEVEAEDFPSAFAGAASAGGGNVTLPYKLAAAELVEQASADVRATGACNCFWSTDGGTIVGDNTDVEGFRRAVEGMPGMFLQGADLLLIGAGGAAAAVVRACVLAGASRVHLVNRSPERSRALARRFAKESTEVRPVPQGDLMGATYDLVVNATSLGLWLGDPLPMDLTRIRVGAAMDLVYGPGGTAWTRHARTEGIPAVDGLPMLVHQAALSVENWFGVAPSPEAMLYAARLKLGWGW